MKLLPSKDIKRVAKVFADNSPTHEIERFADRTTQTYDTNGDPVPLSRVIESIDVHFQPMTAGALIKDLVEGQRLEDMKKGWTTKPFTEDPVNVKDRIKEEGIWFTVNAILKWPSHTELDLIRTGEQDNIA